MPGTVFISIEMMRQKSWNFDRYRCRRSIVPGVVQYNNVTTSLILTTGTANDKTNKCAERAQSVMINSHGLFC
jgi:hypothetical protein